MVYACARQGRMASFGATCSPAPPHISFSSTQSEEAANGKWDDIWNPDRLVKCPYDPNHMIRQCRFPYHILKCKKNHPEMESELRTCPYNARHIILKDELSAHMAVCVDRQSVIDELGGNSEVQKKYSIPVNTTAFPTSEDWDKEVETAIASPFVWGVTSQISHSPEVTNNLAPGLRTPHVLPWK
ncbi:gametocyte-specific factor 1-like isoform X1 [Alosa sapidissima]|uniref:gametocyte-specific factor 1-like isoform X1 n=2 Tax=Alosa sapidissima TaxID=34773 RepID=UPI001C09B284|nr:gametocyte-specific factor 1-like isoform X1 [Alosa sapidissima]